MNEISEILSYFLKKADISFNKTKLKQLISSHPDRNSLYAMTDTLDELDIENVALSADMRGLQANGFPVIVHFGKGKRQFVVVEEMVDGKAYYYSTVNGRVVEPLEEFEIKWSGVTLYAAQDDIQAELERKRIATERHLLRWRTIFAVVAGLACFATWIVSVAWSFNVICLLSLCVLGLAVSILLTLHEFGESNRLLHKVCHLNRLTNCNAVLKSPASKLFGLLSMADIGLCYFAGSILSLMLSCVSQYPGSAIPWLLALAVCSFPYTVFSLWYQTYKVKQFCPMCLGVISVLWTEIALAIISWQGLMFFPLSPVTVFSLMAGFALPVITWAFVKPLWKEYIRIRDFEFKFLRLKRSPDIIRTILTQEPARDMEFTPDEINLGIVDAPIHITVVLSMHCRPCIDAWTLLDQWLATYLNSFRATIRFHGYNFAGPEINELIDALTGIYIQSGNDTFRKALTEWYIIKDVQQWKAKYHADTPVVPQLLSSKNDKWERMNFIAHVPVIFVDNRIYPYELDDLESLLKENERNKNDDSANS